MSDKLDDSNEPKQPKFTLEEYRKFIRDAAPYISLIAGRKIKASEADSMSDAEMTALALKIDERVADLHKSKGFGPKPKPEPEN